MNKFTKEELLEILDYCNWEPTAVGMSIFRENLWLKIQSMIDNYCDHEWENICCQCSLDNIYCHKCEKDIGDLKQRYEE